MGAKISLKNRNGVRLTNDKCYSTDSNRNQFKLEAVILSRDEVDEILEDSAYETGTYILYEEPERKKTFLAFKTVDEKIAHYAIVKANDLYYFNDFPFPYLESIVLYYKKYKFKGTQLTKQAAVVPPQLRLQENRASAKSLSASADFLNDNDKTWTSANEKTWTYGHYDILSTRL